MEKLRVAILGAGEIANRMAKTLNDMDTACAFAIASRDLEKARRYAKEYGFARAYGAYSDLLADPEVDLVYIAVPHALHMQYSKMCIDAGKPVLCEKPFSYNAETAQEVFQYARRRGVFITEANWVWYMPMVQALRQFAGSGEIGEIYSMTSSIGWPNSGAPRIHEPDMAGGALLDMGIYPITLSRILFGDQIERIDTSVQMGGTGVDMQSTVALQYPGNRMSSMFMSTYTSAERTAVLHGTRGYAVLQDVNNYTKLTVFDDDKRERRTVDMPHQSTGFEYEVNACARALREGRLECGELPHSATVETLKICDAIRKSWGLKYPME